MLNDDDLAGLIEAVPRPGWDDFITGILDEQKRMLDEVWEDLESSRPVEIDWVDGADENLMET